MFTLRIVLLSSATLAVAFAQNPISADSPFQVRYAANLPAVGSANPDSVVNITNTGARGGVTNQSGTTASIGGAICVNVYGFDSDEQMVGCCSCPVTPNGLVSLSATQDIISNTLTPRRPTSLVIKLLSTVPVGGTCTNSAGTVTTATLAPGLAAWGTTAHVGPAAGTFSITETAFTPSSLSASELAHLGSVCQFIIGQGSGFGICKSCRLGGLGGVKQ